MVVKAVTPARGTAINTSFIPDTLFRLQYQECGAESELREFQMNMVERHLYASKSRFVSKDNAVPRKWRQ